MKNLKTTISGAFGFLGTSLAGIGVLSQFAGDNPKHKAILFYVAIIGFIMSALSKFALGIVAEDAKKPEEPKQ